MVWLFGLTIVLILSFYWAKGGLVKEGQSQKKTDYWHLHVPDAGKRNIRWSEAFRFMTFSMTLWHYFKWLWDFDMTEQLIPRGVRRIRKSLPVLIVTIKVIQIMIQIIFSNFFATYGKSDEWGWDYRYRLAAL